MRHIATLALVVVLVVGTVPTGGMAAATQYGGDAQYTTDVASGHTHDSHSHSHSSTADDATAGNATVTGYEIPETTLAPNESLRLAVTGRGEGSTAMVLALDGERYDLGDVTADGERVAFERAGARTEGASNPIEIHCEGGYNSDDGWWLRCEITFGTISAGTHDVGINDLEPTAIHVEDASGAAGNLTATDFEVADRVVNPEERLRLTVRGSADEPGSMPLALTVDGERRPLGSVSVSEDGASFEPADSVAPIDVDVRCEVGYNSEDGWWVRCVIEIEAVAIDSGSHDVGINGLEPTRVEVDPDEAYLTGYAFQNRTLQPGEVLATNLTFDGESGSVPIDLAVDGEQYRIGTVRVEDGRAAFEAAEGDEAAGILFPPWPPGPGMPCPYIPPCIPIPLDVSAGPHDVGINGMEPTTVAVGEELRLTGYEFAGTVAPANDTAATVSANDSVTIRVRGEGVGEAPLALTVDGERHHLGTLSVSADGASFEPAATIPWPDDVDVDVECVIGYNSEDGWWMECEVEIDVEWATVGTGSHDVGVNDLEPTRIEVESAEARLAGYAIPDRTVEVGGTLRLNVSVEGESGSVPLVLTVDGREYRAGTLHVEDGAVKRVETADAEAAPINFVPCPDLQDDFPWIVLCAHDIPSVAQGTHQVGVDDMEPTEVTVESGDAGILGGIRSFLSDLLRALGGFFGLDGDAE